MLNFFLIGDVVHIGRLNTNYCLRKFESYGHFMDFLNSSSLPTLPKYVFGTRYFLLKSTFCAIGRINIWLSIWFPFIFFIDWLPFFIHTGFISSRGQFFCFHQHMRHLWQRSKNEIVLFSVENGLKL